MHTSDFLYLQDRFKISSRDKTTNGKFKKTQLIYYLINRFITIAICLCNNLFFLAGQRSDNLTKWDVEDLQWVHNKIYTKK